MGQSKILILGTGGREHALCWHLKNSGVPVECAPGSDAIANLCPTWNFKNFDELYSLITVKNISEVIVGPEKYLADGVADFLTQKGISVFGPSKMAAQLETDKAFAKNFMEKFNLPTAKSETVSSADGLKAALKKFRAPYVVKAAGLAAGKGVWIGDNIVEAENFGKLMFKEHTAVVIEEFLNGEEASYFVLIDGKKHLYFGAAQDHKRLSENDEGPNTGGMGAYSPVPVLTDELQQRVEKKIIAPLLKGLESEKIYYRGFLFVGLMIVQNEPYILEFNCRLGDPETQALMLRLKTPLHQAIAQIPKGTAVEFQPGVSLSVVVAAEGYPDSPKAGFSIPKIDTPPKGVYVFHSGTTAKNGEWTAKGGRLFSAVTTEPSLAECQRVIYSWLEDLQLKNITYRKDVGSKAFRHLITGPILIPRKN